MSEDMEVREWPGYTGCFSREQAKGAIPNGTLVYSKNGHVAGLVLGSIDATEVDKALCERKHVHFAYWIEWEDRLRVAYFVSDRRIKVGKKSHDAEPAEPAAAH